MPGAVSNPADRAPVFPEGGENSVADASQFSMGKLQDVCCIVVWRSINVIRLFHAEIELPALLCFGIVFKRLNRRTSLKISVHANIAARLLSGTVVRPLWM